jgi:squalene synthase HpnC
MPTVMSDLSRFGPGAMAPAPTLAEARAYCRRLAATHYENFTVASWLVPRELRPHFHAIYAYCRWADDLADETDSPAESLALLDWWQASLEDCFRGRATHPVFVALAETVAEFAIPIEPFRGLLIAFRRDQQQHRYETFDELRDYCRGSADPVGRLVLHLGRCHDEERGALSDQICTGLQLANFCQDVARDWRRGRVYLPGETLGRFGYDEAMFVRDEMNEAFRRVMETEVERAERFLLAGLPLADRVPAALQVQVELFARGGLAILASIRRIGYDVWRVWPTVSRWDKLRLLASCWWRRRVLGRSATAAFAGASESTRVPRTSERLLESTSLRRREGASP